MTRNNFALWMTFLFAAGTGMAQSVTLNATPSRAVGQPQLFPLSNLVSHASPNLVEGRELYLPYGLAIDASASPAIVYVADTRNSRVLAWKNAAGFNNGQPADLIIGQTDPYSTAPLGPGTSFSATGLNTPTGLAVDSSGNLYVADSGNNRILRFPKPFAQTGQLITPDVLLGQASYSANAANSGGSVSASSVYLSASSPAFVPANIAIDSNGNVWVTDPGNRRVLEFQASDITSGAQGVAAKLVLGQPDFSTLQTVLSPSLAQAPLTKSQFAIPIGVALDKAGRIYVSDTDGGASNNSRINRVLVFDPKSSPLVNGRAADRVLGGGCLALALSSNTACPALGTNISGGGESGNANFPYDTLLFQPSGIFLLPPDASNNQSVGVVDSGYSRILIFPAYSQWPAETVQYSPEATAVLGQSGFTSLSANGNTDNFVITPPATPANFSTPRAAALLPSTGELFVTDSGNNRVIVMPPSQSTGSGFGSATRVLGQDRLSANGVNLIEGKEFYFASGGGTLGDAGIAIDTNSSVPHLYVADPHNNRVMGFYDIRKITPGQKADFIIGQQDGTTNLCNFIGGLTTSGGSINQRTSSSLCLQENVSNGSSAVSAFGGGVLVDALGNLYVADFGNGRVLRFPSPFGQCPNGPGSANCTLPVLPQADLVLGQSNFSSKITDPSNTSMAGPYGLAFSGGNGLLVSDEIDNRVLYFPFNTTVSGVATFSAGSNGLAATKVYGQPDFVSTGTGSAGSQVSVPHGIAADSSGQPYVADTGNNRVLIFPDPNNPLTPAAGSQPLLTLTCATTNNGSCSQGLNSPRAILVNATTGEIWVANSGLSTVVRFPQYNTLIINNAPTGSVSAYGPLALAQDQYGDLFVADSANRVAAYYQGTAWQNDASYFTVGQTPGLAPGSVAALYPIATLNQFGSKPAASFDFSAFPMPNKLADLQVLVNGTPAPLYYVSPSQINFVVPMNAPNSGSADVVVTQVSTGQIFGAGSLQMNSVAPGIFMGGQITTGAYQAAVVNQDGSVNSQNNPAARGSIISIYATGQGVVPGAPADGALPTALVNTPSEPQILIGSCFVEQCQTLPGDQPMGKRVQFSGLSPSYPGLWQINVYVPMVTVPSGSGSPVPVDIVYNNVPAWSASSPYKTFFWVK